MIGTCYPSHVAQEQCILWGLRGEVTFEQPGGRITYSNQTKQVNSPVAHK